MSGTFLDTLADMPPPDQLAFLAAAAGAIIREAAVDQDHARAAVDRLLTVIERAAGLE